ncbi:uncharacterized protein LOC115066318 [Bactrocera dorsalis]|uniref:Uncharacterized protein LOC115066318 n=1 Tax=Bactrocera dorsalis TaxID=27457 RepID=A0ABM3J8Z3_BACDO|nr:uncharacterized protein LOC115066318 [Bactrocera dorsalis]
MSNKEVLIRTKHEILEKMESRSAYNVLKAFARNSRKGIQFLVWGFFITTFQLFYIRMSYNVNRSPLEDTVEITVNKSASTKLFNVTDSYLSMANDNETQTKYFIYTSQCRIPYVDPFDGGVSEFFNPKDFKYTNCANDESFITINYQVHGRQYLLHMNMEAIERAVKPLNASTRDVRCCYQQIVRAEIGGKTDSNYKLLNCVIFHQNFIVPQHIDYIITECYVDKESKRTIQKDAFSFIQTPTVVQLKNVTGSASKNQSAVLDAIKPSVLLFGIDALSRINLRRTMPLTFKYLQSNQWFESNNKNVRSITFDLLLSDHGMRWGPLLQLKSGFLEERLPTMFISIPSWYQNKYPDFMKNLQINQRRLTTPYDIYATMKHILEVVEPEKEFPYLNGTIHGVSIFREIPEDRTCDNAGIPEHWCACVPYEIVPTSDEVAKNVTALVLGEMIQYLVNKNISDKCAELKLETIDSSQTKMIKIPNESTYRISFEANPEKVRFQATFVYNITTNTIKTDVEDISRLDSYAKTSNCIDLKEEKKYCICNK